MPYLKRFTKAPSETIDYTIDFSDWLAERGSTFTTFYVDAEPGLNVVLSEKVGDTVRLVIGAGEDGYQYVVAVDIVTNDTPALRRRAEILLNIRGSGVPDAAPIDGGEVDTEYVEPPLDDGDIDT
jgi:hypothetical protein